MPPKKGTKRKATATESTSQAQDLPVRAKDDSPLPTIAPAKPSTQGTLKVFDDDDNSDVDVAVTTTLSAVEKPRVIADSEEESESDDDEAPEAVATTHVVSKAEKSAKSAQQAAQEQAAEQKRKRQQRDALFKQQATERKATKSLKEALKSTQDRESTKGMRISGIPSALPEEFLDSSSENEDEDDDDEVDSVTDTRPKRRKISVVEQKLARLDRGPRDERIGSTVYRVDKKRDERLAPKAQKHAQSRKGGLLSRGRAPVATKGFFKK